MAAVLSTPLVTVPGLSGNAVFEAALAFCRDVNNVGLGENTPHHGFTFIIGPGEVLLKKDADGDYEYLQPPDDDGNNFFGKNVLITNLSQAQTRALKNALQN